MRLLVCRARAEGERTAARLRKAGHEALLAPVLELRALHATLPAGPFAALIATSAHALEGLEAAAIAAWRDTLLFAVGARTAQAARGLGFTNVRQGESGAADLVGHIAQTIASPSALLYLTGTTRTPLVETRLAGLGHGVAVVETYAMVEALPWPGEIVERLRAGTVDGCLHFSARSAALAFSFALQHDLAARFAALDHFCLSGNVAEAVAKAGGSSINVAESPNESALMRLIRGSRGQNGQSFRA